jgi:putative molybdopterin biosynthesis protein
MVKRYLTLVTREEALERIYRSFDVYPGLERVPVERARGRITASPIFARFSVPEVHLAAMDGIAVRSRDTIGASEQNPVTVPDARMVNTGNIVDPQYDAVIMIEDVWKEGDRFTIRRPVSPWQHIRPVGEDIGESEMILPSHHRIRASELGALSAFGITEVEVLRLRAGLIPTGSELVPRGVRPGPGQVVESNTLMAAAWLEELGVTCTGYPITPDDPGLIRKHIADAVAENDMVLVSAGSSAGTRDYTAGIIAELGEVLIHGISMKPGKPVIIGKIEGKPVIGLPGYPLSALTVLREIVTPIVAAYGLEPPAEETVPAQLAATLQSEIGMDEFVLLTIGRIGSGWVAVPQSRGAGVQMSAVRANAYLRVPRDREGFESGELVDARLTVPKARAGEALLITGSHDPALDHLSDLLQQKRGELHSIHVGSMGGLIALKKHQCHAAPMHLLAENGEYNIPYLQKYLPGSNLVLVCIAERQQGIVSRTGDITLDTLAEHTFINRQRGSGTRMLLDQLLKEKGIDPAAIRGYDHEVITHLAVALAVKMGEAEAGMCVYSAAKALGLPFVPVAQERYELVLHRESLEDTRVAALIETIASDSFKQVLKDLGGYDTSETGVQRMLP